MNPDGGWTAPDVERAEPPFEADERAMLQGWLDYHRATLLHKCAGLTAAQLATASVPPSTLTLLGLVRHMADVERGWFRIRFAGQGIPFIYCTDENPEGDFDDIAGADADADLAAFIAECAEVDRSVAGGGLNDTFAHERTGEAISLRWVYTHMIEEYARHNGHADLVRQCIDGATGD